MIETIVSIAVIIISILAFIALAACVQSVILMWAWNLIIPIFWHAAPHLAFLQAFAAWLLIDCVGVALNTLTVGFFKKG